MKKLLLILVVVSTIAPAFAQNQVMFHYQGLVRSGGQPFDGDGQFKFAVIAIPGPETLWSNDGSSVSGAEPTASLEIPVARGVFNVLVGDPSLGMSELNSSVLNHPGIIFLRVWFNDGTHGFQQLRPDHRLVNLALMTVRSGTNDFSLYVDTSTGNDSNSGLQPSRAKKTIQAALETLPERLRCNVTVNVSPGIYREEINLYGISSPRDKKLLLVGDASWTPASAADPTVRITGRDSDGAGAPIVRANAVYARQCAGVEMQGFLFDYAKEGGALVVSSNLKLDRCKASNNDGYAGMIFTDSSQVDCVDCVCTKNTVRGFGIAFNSRAHLTSCRATDNGNIGLGVDTNAEANIYTSIDFSGNGGNGVSVQRLAYLGFGNPITGKISNNGDYGLYVNYNSIAAGTNRPSVNLAGNGAGDKYAHLGGAIYP